MQAFFDQDQDQDYDDDKGYANAKGYGYENLHVRSGHLPGTLIRFYTQFLVRRQAAERRYLRGIEAAITLPAGEVRERRFCRWHRSQSSGVGYRFDIWRPPPLFHPAK